MLFRNKKPNDHHEGKWNGLGGKIEPGESPEECAVREVREESGLETDSLLYKGFIAFPRFDGVHDWQVHVFVITAFHGNLRPCPEGELSWIDDEKLLDLNLWEGDRIFLPWLSRPDFFSAKFVYENKKLISHHPHFYTSAPAPTSQASP